MQELGPDAKPTELMKELARRYNEVKKKQKEEESKNASNEKENKKRKRTVEEEPEPTECATCQERTIAPMFRCPSGHIVCWKCNFGFNPKLHKCPGCPMDDEGLSLGDMVAACRKLGLPATGSKAQMQARLLQAMQHGYSKTKKNQ